MKTVWFLVYMWSGVIPLPYPTEDACRLAAQTTSKQRDSLKWTGMANADGRTTYSTANVFAAWDCVEAPKP